MYAVYFLENKNVLMCQLLRNIPIEGDVLTIKGRKGTVAGVEALDGTKVHVHMVIQKIPKAKTAADNSKKKKR
ncbi:preprotein translocase subunit SecA [Mesobacillus campisalis]|uniref:Preprotein translocase subunit SecA n=1 Tax=Mesobacillus campisalis TaxID=1408103 RepID=A0A0M2T197_9BACI|nr:hypothetical protein [Mesobacillus campisalis]KKK38600.1 preprotein translocase subunit SecA [Mesobacillus campisalis]